MIYYVGHWQAKRSDLLPDDILLEIFDFCVGGQWEDGKGIVERWQLLVHVCQRWRDLVFRSPRRLNLQLYCTPKTPAKDTLDVWPALPLIVRGSMDTSSTETDNVIAALGQNNRVSQVFLYGLADRQLEQVLVSMQVPFPKLTRLWLTSDRKTLPVVNVIPDSLLDGSAPRLRGLDLYGIPFPGLPKLLLSATHLVHFVLSDVPHSGYISPESMVALLSVLSSLEFLSLGFQSPQSRPDQVSRRPPPSKRSVLPALIVFRFKGVIEYLEDLVTPMDAPQLDGMDILFFNQINVDTPRLVQFIHRTPKLKNRDALAHVLFIDGYASVSLPPRSNRALKIGISCEEPDWQLSSIEQVCNSLHPLSTVEDLCIGDRYQQLVWKSDAIDSALWLQLLLPFTAVKHLYLSKELSPVIATALKELVEGRIMEVLPSLQNIFVDRLESSGPFQENIGQFVAARQLSDHPIAISVWDKDSDVKPM